VCVKETTLHELTICESLIEMLAEERRSRGFAAVRRLTVEIGRFSCLDPEALRFAFEVTTRDTFLGGATLVIERPAARAHCLDCGTDFEIRERTDGCPACSGARLNTTGGDRMRLVEMEVVGPGA
jgi:hydrogenase nickel incorporation protein HypA/HybF